MASQSGQTFATIDQRSMRQLQKDLRRMHKDIPKAFKKVRPQFGAYMSYSAVLELGAKLPNGTIIPPRPHILPAIKSKASVAAIKLSIVRETTRAMAKIRRANGGSARRVREYPQLTEQLIRPQGAYDHLTATGLGLGPGPGLSLGIDIRFAFQYDEGTVGGLAFIDD